MNKTKKKVVDWWNVYRLERKVADIIARQEYNGWQFDLEGAEKKYQYLSNEMVKLYDEIRPNLWKVLNTPYGKKPINKPFLKNGNYSSSVTNWYSTPEIVSGSFTRIEWDEPNIGSDKQLKELLFRLGWEPTEWNYKKDKSGKKIYENGKPIKTSPKLTEDSYNSLSVGIGPQLARYLKCSHRRSQLKGLIDNVDDNGFIHAGANPLGTPTGRMRHNVVVNIPKNDPGVFFGKEMRECFIHRPGRILVGHDASGLEARILAHCLNDPEMTYQILHGDFHTYFWNPLKDFIASRGNAKNIEYAYIFGAQEEKLGSMVDYKPNGWSNKKVGTELKKIIAQSIPALGELTDKVQRAAKKGYLVGLDGRKLFVRSQHSALNLYIQGTGATVMKTSMCFLDNWVKRNNLDVIKVGDFHDEAQADSLIEHAELYGELAVESIRKAGKFYNLNCPLDGEYKIGHSWAETH